MTGLDVAAAAAALATVRHGDLPNLEFTVGDAEGLALPDASFDIVLNIESAHCYASVPRFLSEAARALRPAAAHAAGRHYAQHRRGAATG